MLEKDPTGIVGELAVADETPTDAPPNDDYEKDSSASA